jgi:glycoprotein endo-alpha-1,2-mannosidase
MLLLIAPAAAAPRPEAQVSIFYYPWYGTPVRDGSFEHWQQAWHLPPTDIASNYYPLRGAYSSGNPAVVAAQMNEIRSAGVGVVVTSWWGLGSPEDLRLQMLLRIARAHRLSVAVQIEPYEGRSATSVAADLAHLVTLGVTRYYVYRPFDLLDADWQTVNAGVSGVEVLAQTGDVARAAADRFSGIYTYDVLKFGARSLNDICARARAAHLTCAPSVGPGYEADRATGDTRVKPRRDGATYDAMWTAAIQARADRITITSYNEWHEGTQIEPASASASRALAASPTERLRYETYDGAYGLHGAAASRAYLDRTAAWAKVFAQVRAGRLPRSASP